MSTAVQHRRGTTAQHASFTGLEGEITVDTDLNTARVHDGSTAGGHVLLTEADIDEKADLASPTFTGTPAAPTAAPGTDTTQLATTAFVQAVKTALIGGAGAGADTLGEIETTLALKAPLASPTLTGTPTAPTASAGTNTTQIATTAHVKATADLKANVASPSFTGTVTLPTSLTGVLRADSGVVSADTDVTDIVSAASTSAAGKVELATVAEALANTDTSRAVTPAGLFYPAGHLWGLTLSNNATDATNDIDIAFGTCRDSLDTENIVLASALTKQLDAAWAVGTNQGMRATGVAIADGTYHIFVIKRPDTGVVDIAADTSASGANIAANTNAAYTVKRRIGSIIRSGGAILGFTQTGDRFDLTTGVSDRSSTSALSEAAVTVSVPTGIVVSPIMHSALRVNSSSVVANALRNGDSSGALIRVLQAEAGGGAATVLVGPVKTNTSAQIRMEVTVFSGTVVENVLTTVGWVDTRNRFA